MKLLLLKMNFLHAIFLAGYMPVLNAQELYQAPPANTHTRWISPENPDGEKGKGGLTNQGAKGNAFLHGRRLFPGSNDFKRSAL